MKIEQLSGSGEGRYAAMLPELPHKVGEFHARQVSERQTAGVRECPILLGKALVIERRLTGVFERHKTGPRKRRPPHRRQRATSRLSAPSAPLGKS